MEAFFLDSFSQYYGLDWIIFLGNMIAVWLLGDKNKFGFVVRASINLVWIALGIVINSIPLIVAGMIFAILNTRGFWKWKKEEIQK